MSEYVDPIVRPIGLIKSSLYCCICHGAIDVLDLRARSEKKYIRALAGENTACLECELILKTQKKCKIQNHTFCAYCGFFGNVTKDHVVPKSFLKKIISILRSSFRRAIYVIVTKEKCPYMNGMHCCRMGQS